MSSHRRLRFERCRYVSTRSTILYPETITKRPYLIGPIVRIIESTVHRRWEQPIQGYLKDLAPHNPTILGHPGKGHPAMKTHQIVDRGDGPKIEGTRITVYTIFEYLEKGRSREWIAACLGLSSRQVQAAMDYIGEHRADVQAEYQKIAERIRRGNSPSVEQRLQHSRDNFQQLMAHRHHEAVEHAQDHGGQ